MTWLAQDRIHRDEANQYATAKDFCSVFTEDLSGLYQLSFLLTRDHQEAEHCFVAGVDDCVKASRVFREWARTWAKRTIIQNAIRALQSHPSQAHPSLLATVSAHSRKPPDAHDAHFEIDSVLALQDFERFVFVMFVLEHYTEHDCSLLLGCSLQDIRKARSRALERIVNSGRMVLSHESSFEDVQEMKR
ncbi:MAG TPA: hypothetical protein VE957_08825 [Terriglobales bacterium]|nr:hypothetical protein [Terriglobales bacterium]